MDESHRPNNGTLKDMLVGLDCFLTGADYETALHTFECSPSKMADFLNGREYYLSDGGYSRLVCKFDTHENGEHFCKLFLTSNSLDETKANWQYVKELKADIESKVLEHYLHGEWNNA